MLKIAYFGAEIGRFGAQNLGLWSKNPIFGWLVGGCGARAVSRKTPIYFIYALNIVSNKTKIFTNIFIVEFHARLKKEMCQTLVFMR